MNCEGERGDSDDYAGQKNLPKTHWEWHLKKVPNYPAAAWEVSRAERSSPSLFEVTTQAADF
jgi:hypothetical protein